MIELEDTLQRAEAAPATFAPADVRRRVARRARRRIRRRVGMAAAAVVAAGLTVATVLPDRGPADVTTAAPSAESAPNTEDTVVGVSVPPLVDLVGIEASSSSVEGTTEVTLLFDNPLPARAVEPVGSVQETVDLAVGFTTQSSVADEAISVCGDQHWFPPPGNRTVDVLIPSAWFAPSAALDPGTVTWTRPAAAPAKIITCPAREGVVQISIWGAASARIDDVTLTVTDNRIEVSIRPSEG